MYSLCVLNRKIRLYGGILYNKLNALVSLYIIFKSIHVQYVENVDSRKFLNANNSKDRVKENVLTMKLKFYESKSGNNSIAQIKTQMNLEALSQLTILAKSMKRS